jgi:tRNA A-37 threonylcarbamoyl transferase component Bud32
MTTSTSPNAQPAHHLEVPAVPGSSGPDKPGPDNCGPGSTGADNTGLDNTGLGVIGGRYRLGGQIGRGAMGRVWRAKDELLDREVAVKEVRLPSSVSDAERANSYQRTLREARTAARLSHPGVAAVYDVVEELGRPWIVMELVPGRSLDQVINEDGPLLPGHAADVGRRVLAALSTAHAAGVLHRDVKPSNVLLAKDGRAVLTDFGIATVEGDPSLTQTGMVMGSPGFLAPERIRGDVATPASDLWSLGATLYAAVEGQGPYDRHGGVMTTMAAVVTEDPRPPIAAGPLTPVITALLSRDPAQRPSASAAAGMLDAAGGVRRPAALPWTGAGPDDSGSGGRPHATPYGTPHGGMVPSDGGRGPDQADGIQHRAQTLRPSAILPPDAPPPDAPPPGLPSGLPSGPRPWSAPGVPGPAQLPAVTPAQMAAAQMPPAQLPPVPRAPAPSAAAQMAPAPIRPPTAMTPSPSATPPITAPPVATARVVRTPMGPPPMGPGAAGGPTSIGPAPVRNVPPRQKHRVGTVVIVGVAVFITAAIAAAEIHKANSARTTTQRQSAGAGQAARGESQGPGPSHGEGGSQAANARGGPLPAGARWYSQRVGAAGSGTAGFRVALPDGWRVSRNGMRTFIEDPAGARFLELDLTPHTHASMLAELSWLQRQSLLQGTFPGYRRSFIRPVLYQRTIAADWAFSWYNQSSGRIDVLDRVLIARGPGATQSFAIYWSTPAPQWQMSQPQLNEVLRTFSPVW